MSSIAISGDTSGAVTIAAPAIAGTNTMTLVAGTGTLAPKVLSTAVASTSGTSIDFMNIPSWVTRITVMFSGVSTNGTSNYLIQIGSGSFATSGYSASSSAQGTGTSGVGPITTGFVSINSSAANLFSGAYTITNITGNVWVLNGVLAIVNSSFTVSSAGNCTLSGALDRVRITTASSDTFDAGTINIMYE